LLLDQLDKRFVPLLIKRQGPVSEAAAIPDSSGEIAGLFGAQPVRLHLLRPDLHIAGRWKAIVPDDILRTARIFLGKQTR
jgi:3-(3-hydroxy-phenyl)propionate hydroxylase